MCYYPATGAISLIDGTIDTRKYFGAVCVSQRARATRGSGVGSGAAATTPPREAGEQRVLAGRLAERRRDAIRISCEQARERERGASPSLSGGGASAMRAATLLPLARPLCGCVHVYIGDISIRVGLCARVKTSEGGQPRLN